MASGAGWSPMWSCGRPDPTVGTRRALVASLAAKAVPSTPSLDAATKVRFRAASPADRLLSLYDQRNDAAARPGTGRELVEARLFTRLPRRRWRPRGEPLHGRRRSWPGRTGWRRARFYGKPLAATVRRPTCCCWPHGKTCPPGMRAHRALVAGGESAAVASWVPAAP